MRNTMQSHRSRKAEISQLQRHLGILTSCFSTSTFHGFSYLNLLFNHLNMQPYLKAFIYFAYNVSQSVSSFDKTMRNEETRAPYAVTFSEIQFVIAHVALLPLHFIEGLMTFQNMLRVRITNHHGGIHHSGSLVMKLSGNEEMLWFTYSVTFLCPAVHGFTYEETALESCPLFDV